MKTVLKVIVVFILVAALASLCLELAGVVIGASFSLVGVFMNLVGLVFRAAGSLLSLALRLIFNPIVLVLIVVFLLARPPKSWVGK